MRRFLPILCLLLLPASAGALEVPRLTGYVSDYAGMISAGAKISIEAKLKAFEQSDSTQIVVLTVPSLEGEDLERFSIHVAEAWKIGQKSKDNGAILLVASQERRIRIEVGRGLEGRLTDLLSGRIIDTVIKPRFKAGNYDDGFIAGTQAMIDAVRGEFSAEEEPGPDRGPKAPALSFPLIMFLLFAGFASLRFLGKVSPVLGGAAGALGLPAVVYLFLTHFALPILAILAVVGFILGLVLSRIPAAVSGGHGGGFWHTGGGSGWGGGGFGGGFSGGGGSFGGGGASGSW